MGAPVVLVVSRLWGCVVVWGGVGRSRGWCVVGWRDRERNVLKHLCAHLRIYARIYAYMVATTLRCEHLRIYARMLEPLYMQTRALTHMCEHLRIYVSINAYM